MHNTGYANSVPNETQVIYLPVENNGQSTVLIYHTGGGQINGNT